MEGSLRRDTVEAARVTFEVKETRLIGCVGAPCPPEEGVSNQLDKGIVVETLVKSCVKTVRLKVAIIATSERTPVEKE